MHQVQPSQSAMNIALKVIFFVHVVCITWALQSNWAPSSYFFYNSIFVIVLIWSMHQQDSEEAISMALYFNIVCILLDVINVGIYYPSNTGSISKRFSSGMAIVNLLLRPISSFMLYKMVKERQAYCDLTLQERSFSTGSKANRRGPYVDIEASTQPGFAGASGAKA